MLGVAYRRANAECPRVVRNGVRWSRVDKSIDPIYKVPDAAREVYTQDGAMREKGVVDTEVYCVCCRRLEEKLYWRRKMVNLRRTC